MDKVERKELWRAAKNALANSYAPYSGFHVGAALLAEDGEIFTGVNVENASYGATICAERTAAVKAVSRGKRKFTAIAVASDHGEAPMCGLCRQFLAEFNPGLTVIGGETEDRLTETGLDTLLPEQFHLDIK